MRSAGALPSGITTTNGKAARIQRGAMKDTIDLLEAIGSDASLRHLPGDELAKKLDASAASEALKTAATRGDSSPLFVELGADKQEPPQVVQIQPLEEEAEPDAEEPPVPSVPKDK
jgi:hypothetical protein